MSAFCEPATQTSTFQASVGRSVAPRPLMASTTNTAGVAATISPSALMSFKTPVLVSLNWQKTALASGCSASAAAHALGIDLGAPLVIQRDHVGAPEGGELGPALAEVAARGHDHRVARLDEIDHGALHGARAGAGEDDHVVVGLIDVLQPGDDVLEDLGEARRPVVDHRLTERREHLGRHRGRPGSQQVAFLHRVRPFDIRPAAVCCRAGRERHRREGRFYVRRCATGKVLQGRRRSTAFGPATPSGAGPER